MKKDKPLKYCEAGSHYVTNLFHSKRKDRPSACALHAERKPIKKRNLIEEATQHVYDLGWADVKIKSAIAKVKPKDDKSIPELLKLAEIVFNRFIRRRDTLSDGTFRCVSCNMFFSAKEMDAGHFKTKKYSAIRFNELNVHGQCHSCNRMKDGNEKQYRINLIDRIGLPLVEYIDWASNQPWKWDKQNLLEIISKYK